MYGCARRASLTAPATSSSRRHGLKGTGPCPSEIIACRNGLLHVPSGELLEPTPRFFTRNALAFDFLPDAPAPRQWLDFLNQVWPGGEEIELLQEIFGYLLVPDTSQQKIFLLVGPKRSGKGTIGQVLAKLIGERNVCSPSLNSLGDTFGLEPLIGKQLAIVSDMRVGFKTDIAAVAEDLLRISGEDSVSVNRKFKEAVTGKLAVRFLIMSNETPRLPDASGALASRFIPLMMENSFYGREDHGLTDRLLTELPGILKWAIERLATAPGPRVLPFADQLPTGGRGPRRYGVASGGLSSREVRT